MAASGTDSSSVPFITTKKRWATPILYPNNLEDLRGDLGRANFWAGAGIATIVGLAGPPGVLLAAVTGLGSVIGNLIGTDPNIAAIAKQMHFVQASQQARIEMNVLLTTKRVPPAIHLSFSINLAFEVDRYHEEDRTGVIYQDRLKFEIRRWRDPETEGPDGPMRYPETYNVHSASWDMKTANMPPWLLSGSFTPEPYDPANPMSLVVHGPFTKYLKEPEANAMRRVEIQLLPSVPITEDQALSDFDLSFAIAQRVMYARVVGRSGAPGLKVGGVPVIVPAMFLVSGVLRVDFPNNALSIREDTQQFKTFSG